MNFLRGFGLRKWLLAWWIVLVVVPYLVVLTPIGKLIGYGFIFRLAQYLSFPAAVFRGPFFQPADWGTWQPSGLAGWLILLLSHSAVAFGVAWLCAKSLRRPEGRK